MHFEFRKLTLAWSRFGIALVLTLVCAGNITNSVLLKWHFRDVPSIVASPPRHWLARHDGRPLTETLRLSLPASAGDEALRRKHATRASGRALSINHAAGLTPLRLFQQDYVA